MTTVLERVARDPRGAALLAEVGQRALAQHVVHELRRVQQPLIQYMRRDINDALKQLGELVSETYLHVQRPILEAQPTPPSGDMINFVEHILASSSLRQWAGHRLSPSFVHWYSQNLGSTARVLIASGLLSNVRGAAADGIMRLGGTRAGLVDITGDTRVALFRALEQAQAEGLGPRLTARLIKQMVPAGRFVNAGSAYRAQLISRTEMLHAQRASSLAHYRANRIPKVVAFDGDSDEECAARNGAIFDLGEAEIEMDNTHPNCVLCFSPVAA